MKTNDGLLMLATALYSFLFYHQSAGINFLIFNLVLVAMVYQRKPGLIKKRSWQAAAGGAVLTSLGILLYGNSLSIIANFISLALLSGMSWSPRSSVIVSLIHALFSFVTSIGFFFKDRLGGLFHNSDQMAEKKKGRPILLILIPVVVGGLFFILYRNANLLFKDFTSNINLDFISKEWFLFTFLGYLALCAFWYHKRIPSLGLFDRHAKDSLDPLTQNNSGWTFRLSLDNLRYLGISLLAVLNIIILFVNGVDIYYLYFKAELPEGISLSALVHQSVGLLIVSIVLAVLTLLIFYRGQLYFDPKSRPLRLLAYAWIFQNLIMVISTAYRNEMYIESYQLTHRRIGVFFYLLLTAIGLTWTLIKVRQRRTNWFLIRRLGWSYFTVLVFAVFFNWDGIITRYNISKTEHTPIKLDTAYLHNLSPTNLAQLAEWRLTGPGKNYPDYVPFDELLDLRINEFMSDWENSDWRSWTIDGQKVYRDLRAMQQSGKL